MPELKTCFKKVDYDLDSLLKYIEIGDIGLPDIQRPFVWPATKVRDLFDSMYRGFPVGYLLFWENLTQNGTRPIGTGPKQHVVPNRLIVDGQQRLTSLYSVIRGLPVIDEEYRPRKLEIAFRPTDGRFEVADAAIRRDPEYIADISSMWSSGMSSYALVRGFLDKYKEKHQLGSAAEERMAHNLDRLFDVLKYPFTALEIASTVDEESVADIFVRINSEGVRLNQADFLLTLLSVFWDDGRSELERFCRAARTPPSPGSGPSPFNYFIQPSPDQLMRVDVAVAFSRGRLRSVYQILRGKDPDTDQYSVKKREAQFARLAEVQPLVLDLNRWHSFLSCLPACGFRSGEMISSENALLYAYAFYLVGKSRCGVGEHDLSRLIGRWFFASSLASRYTGAFESTMDSDLSRLKDVAGPDEFVATLDSIIRDTLSADFWSIVLPNELGTSSARSPALLAYYASQVILTSPVLFSDKRVSDLLDPTIRPRKKSLDRHHLFPRGYLAKHGVTEIREVNQIANYAFLEWPDNLGISDAAPAEYLPLMRKRFPADEWERMCDLHGLPDGWENMEYPDFLRARRPLMAKVIQRGFERLSQPESGQSA